MADAGREKECVLVLALTDLGILLNAGDGRVPNVGINSHPVHYADLCTLKKSSVGSILLRFVF